VKKILLKAINHTSTMIVVVSFFYACFYIAACFNETILNIDSDYIKFFLNFTFCLIAFLLTIYSRKHRVVDCDDKEKEWNFSLAFCALVTASVEPLSKLLFSLTGATFIVKHHLILAAIGINVLLMIVLLFIVAVGVKLSKKK